MAVFVGSYSSGISVLSGTGARTVADLDATPSFLAAHPSLPVLYAVSEQDGGAVVAFAIGDDATLTTLGKQPTGGEHPCHLATSPDGRYLAAANYASGHVTVLPLRDDGTIGPSTDLRQHSGSGPDPERQSGPHAHQVTWTGDLLSAVDLGTDTVYDYRLDANGRLVDHGTTRCAPGCGPRHQVFHPSGRRYVVEELTSTISTYDAAGHLDTIPTTLVEPTGRNYPSEVALSDDAHRLYVANRGNDTITTFEVAGDGRLLPRDETGTGGAWPRHFAVGPGKLLVANQHSDTVTALVLDDGGIPRAPSIVAEVGGPSCVLKN
jgi:6-phosphogluconolactonase (cycloisomerase 2 family)